MRVAGSMDARNVFFDPSERLDDLGSRLAQIASLVGVPIDTFFTDAAAVDFQELTLLWEATGDAGRAEILLCARAANARRRDEAAS